MWQAETRNQLEKDEKGKAGDAQGGADVCACHWLKEGFSIVRTFD